MNTTSRTHLSPERVWIGAGAVRQHDGKLPLYICNRCGGEVVWATGKTGRKYLANVTGSFNGARFYIGASLHDAKCDQLIADREQREFEDESKNDARYLIHLMDQHEAGEHPSAFARCLYCERGYANGTDQRP